MVVTVQHGGHGGLLPAGEDGLGTHGNIDLFILVIPIVEAAAVIPAGEAIAGTGGDLVVGVVVKGFFTDLVLELRAASGIEVQSGFFGIVAGVAGVTILRSEGHVFGDGQAQNLTAGIGVSVTAQPASEVVIVILRNSGNVGNLVAGVHIESGRAQERTMVTGLEFHRVLRGRRRGGHLVHQREGGEGGGREGDAVLADCQLLFAVLHIGNDLNLFSVLEQVVQFINIILPVQTVKVDHIEGAALLGVPGDGPVDGDGVSALHRHIGVAVGAIHQIQIHEVVLRILEFSLDCVFGGFYQRLRSCRQLVCQQMNFCIVPDRDGAFVDVVSHVIGCDSRDLIKLLRFFSYNCAGRIFALHAPDRQVTRIHKDGIGVAFNNGLNLICLDVFAAVDGHGIFLIQGFHIKLKPIAGLFLASCIFDQKPNGGLLSTGFQLIDEFLIGNVVGTRRGVVHLQRPMLFSIFLLLFIDERKYIGEVHRQRRVFLIFPQLVVQSGGQGDVEAGLREAVVVLRLALAAGRDWISLAIDDFTGIAVAAGIDGDVGGGDDDLVDVGRAVVVLVIAPQGVDRVILGQVHSVHRGGDRPIFRILDAVDLVLRAAVRRPACEDNGIIAVFGDNLVAKRVVLGFCCRDIRHGISFVAVDRTAVGVIGQIIRGLQLQHAVQVEAERIAAYILWCTICPGQLFPGVDLLQQVIYIFVAIVGRKLVIGKRLLDVRSIFLVGQFTRGRNILRQFHTAQLAQNVVGLRLGVGQAPAANKFLLIGSQRAVFSSAFDPQVDIDVAGDCGHIFLGGGLFGVFVLIRIGVTCNSGGVLQDGSVAFRGILQIVRVKGLGDIEGDGAAVGDGAGEGIIFISGHIPGNQRRVLVRDGEGSAFLTGHRDGVQQGHGCSFFIRGDDLAVSGEIVVSPINARSRGGRLFIFAVHQSLVDAGDSVVVAGLGIGVFRIIILAVDVKLDQPTILMCTCRYGKIARIGTALNGNRVKTVPIHGINRHSNFGDIADRQRLLGDLCRRHNCRRDNSRNHRPTYCDRSQK